MVHNSSGFWVFVSSTTFGHKSCICSMIDSCRLFLRRVSSHHYYVRRRRKHTNRVIFTEITLESFMDQSQGDRSWCHAISGIGRHFGLAGWLAGYVAQIASISRANVFFAALSWRHRFFFCAIERKEVRIKLCASLENASRQASEFSLLANDNPQKIHVIIPDSIWRSSLNVLFKVDRSCVGLFFFSTVLLNIAFLKMGFYCGSMGKRKQCKRCKWKENLWCRGIKRDNS